MTSPTSVPKDQIAEQMRLRSPPPPVMRLSRKALMAGGAIAALVIAGALAFALLDRPSSDAAPELYRVGGTPPETLQALPADYGTRGPDPASVPRLGAPLPGDLGGPILAAQADGVAVVPPAIGQMPAATTSPAATAREAERQRLAQERDGARSSGLFLSMAPSAERVSGAGASAASGPVMASQAGTPGLSAPPSPYTLQAGTLLSGALVTGLRSDLPGMAIGQVTDDAFDSATGRHLLVPKGSRLIGTYDADVAFGQSRVLLVWSRLILPNGRSIALDEMTATDAQGFSGLQDAVDNRWGERLRTAALTTLLAVGSSAGVSSGDDALARALTQGVSGGVSAFGEGLIERGLAVPPRLTIRPGFVFRVIVSRDLVLEPYGETP